MIKRSLILLSCIFILSSCSMYKIESEDVGEDIYPPKQPDQVVYVDTITRPYEVIGYVTANVERRQTEDDIIEKLKREAAMLGGDAITDIQSNASGFWKKLPAQKFLRNAYVRAEVRATVIVFKQSDVGISNASADAAAKNTSAPEPSVDSDDSDPNLK